MTSVMTSFHKAFLLGVSIFLMVWRAPILLLEPRFWAEDGSMFFATAYNQGVWAGLLSPHDGYLLPVANFAGTVAALLPLEYAPYPATAVSLLIQIAVSMLVIYGNSEYWDNFPKKLLLSAGIPFLAHGETWLNTANSMGWLSLASFIILLEPKNQLSPVRSCLYRIVSLVSGFGSVPTCFLFPFYVVKAMRNRAREEFVHAAIIGAGTALQLAILLFSLGSEQSISARFANNEFGLLDTALFYFVYPFTSQSFFNLPYVWAFDTWFQSNAMSLLGNIAYGWPRISEVALSLAGAIWFLSIFWRHRADKTKQLITGSFLLYSLLSIVLSVKMASSPRYAFAPSFMLLVLIVSEFSATPAIVWRSRVSAIYIVGFILFSPLDFRNNVCFDKSWPRWRNEVALWRQYPAYKIRIWPQHEYNNWSLSLKERPE